MTSGRSSRVFSRCCAIRIQTLQQIQKPRHCTTKIEERTTNVSPRSWRIAGWKSVLDRRVSDRAALARERPRSRHRTDANTALSSWRRLPLYYFYPRGSIRSSTRACFDCFTFSSLHPPIRARSSRFHVPRAFAATVDAGALHTRACKRERPLELLCTRVALFPSVR